VAKKLQSLRNATMTALLETLAISKTLLTKVRLICPTEQ